MNREIKFRGKKHKDNTWVYGLLTNDMKGHCRINFDAKSFSCVVKEETVGQFTGLHDNDGTEIYEGDILRSVRFEDILMFIIYDEFEASFMAVQINENIGTDLETRCHVSQEWINKYPKVVIGNICDNKELLEV